MADSEHVEQGSLYVVAAPSGTGKTTLVKALVDSMAKIMVSISHTTRTKRPNEMHGVNYYFISKAEFTQMIAANNFLEYATIFEHYYGTSKRWVTETLMQGIDVILEIDWQGHQQIKNLLPEAIGVFILPPSMDDLRERLIKRNQENADVLTTRLADAQETLSHIKEFDYIVMNDDFTHALHDLKTIIEANRLTQSRQTAKYAALLAKFS